MNWYLGPSQITLNTVGGGNSNENLVTYMLDDLKCSTAVVVNEIKRAQMLIDPGVERQGCPATIYRMHDNAPNAGILNDDSAYSKHKAKDFAGAIWTQAPEGAYLYGGNEFGSANLPAQDRWTSEFVEEVMRLNQTRIADPRRWKRPATHAQFTLHPTQGVSGLQQLRTSVRDTIQAGGIIIPHLYYYETVADELIKGRGAFAIIQEWRQVFGGDFPIVLSEWNYAQGYRRDDGPRGTPAMAHLLDDTIQAAEFLRTLHIYFAIYGIFPPGPDWERFNMLYEPAYLQAIAKWNRENPMSNSVPTIPITGGVRAKVDKMPGAYVNLRRTPNGIDDGDLHLGETVTYFPEAASSDGWVYVVCDDGRKGWVSLQQGKVAFTPVTPPLPPNSPPINVEVATQLAESMDALADDHAAMVEKYRGTASLLRSLFN